MALKNSRIKSCVHTHTQMYSMYTYTCTNKRRWRKRLWETKNDNFRELLNLGFQDRGDRLSSAKFWVWPIVTRGSWHAWDTSPFFSRTAETILIYWWKLAVEPANAVPVSRPSQRSRICWLWPRFINRVTYSHATLCDISEKLCPALKALTLVFPIFSKLFLQPVRSNT